MVSPSPRDTTSTIAQPAGRRLANEPAPISNAPWRHSASVMGAGGSAGMRSTNGFVNVVEGMNKNVAERSALSLSRFLLAAAVLSAKRVRLKLRRRRRIMREEPRVWRVLTSSVGTRTRISPGRRRSRNLTASVQHHYRDFLVGKRTHPLLYL